MAFSHIVNKSHTCVKFESWWARADVRSLGVLAGELARGRPKRALIDVATVSAGGVHLEAAVAGAAVGTHGVDAAPIQADIRHHLAFVDVWNMKLKRFNNSIL